MLLIDPKKNEFSDYRRIPHLMHPVITDEAKATAVLAWAVDKMEERYDLLSRARVRNLAQYKSWGSKKFSAVWSPPRRSATVFRRRCRTS